MERFKEKLFAAAQKRGFKDCELFMVKGGQFSLRVFGGEVTEYKTAGDAGLSFRGTFGGKMGYAYSERVDDDVIDFLVENAAQNAEIIDDPDVEELYAGADAYPTVNSFSEDLANVTPEKKTDVMLAVEKAALARDSRVKQVNYARLISRENEVSIANSYGLNVSGKSNVAYISAFPTAEADGQLKTCGDAWCGKDFGAFDPEAFGAKLADIAVAHLGAKSVKSGVYDVIFDKGGLAELLDVFQGVFSAEQAQKGFSLLAGKVGELIAAPCVTLRDDPLLDGLPGTAAFDSEGVAARNKAVIENGVFKTFLHNLKTAKKDGAEPTGNGLRASIRGAVDVGVTNFYVEKGEKSFDDLLIELGDGLYIDNMEGLGSSANATSGDFSASAQGFLVKNGKIERAVEQITVAANFFDVLKNIQAVGNELEFKGNIASPYVLVKGLSVAGEDA